MTDRYLTGRPRRTGPRSRAGDEALYLTDERLREGIELMFFAYRDFTADPDRILAEIGLGRAHHRALHFIGRRPGITVTGLLDVLGVTKQSFARVLKPLMAQELVRQEIGEKDRRQRRHYLTEAGSELEKRLSAAQRARVGGAFREAGPEAVAGFRRVLELMIDEGGRARILRLVGEE